MFISQEQLQKQAKGPPKWRSTRFLLAYLCCVGVTVLYIQRVSMSLVIVCMVNHTALYHQGHQELGRNHSGQQPGPENVTTTLRWTDDLSPRPPNTSLDQSTAQQDPRCGDNDTDAMPNSDEDGPFVWDKETQGLILAALYVGYCFANIPACMAIRRCGVRVSFFATYMVMSFSHVLCHPAALLSPWAVLALRIVVGACGAFGSFCPYAMWREWAPGVEQSQLMGVTFCGEMIGSFAAFPLTASLCRHGFLEGWPSVFYVFGGLGVAWSVIWFIWMTDSPETHPRISLSEREYIVATRVETTEQADDGAVPWRSILQSSCFWAYLATHYVYAWGLFLLLSNLPTFMYETMHFDIQSNGLYSMLPYIAMTFTVSGSGFIFDAIVERRYLSKLTVRKLVTFVASVVPGVLLVAMSHMECHQTTLVVALLTVAVGATGLAMSAGFVVNTYDLSPRYAFHLFTVGNTIATTSGFINPYLVAVITADGTREQWQIVFYVTGAMYVVGTIVFFVLGKASIQPWAVPKAEETVPDPVELREGSKPEIDQTTPCNPDRNE